MMDRRTEQLLSRYLDGVETPEEFAQLEQQALQDPALRREVVRLAILDTMMRTLLKEAAAARDFSAHGKRIIATAPSLWRTGWVRSVAAAAALVACVGGVNLWQAWQAELAVVATLVEARGQVAGFRVQGSGGRVQGVGRPESGATLRPGTRLSLGPDGYAKLAYADGTLVELGKNTQMILGAGRGSRLFGLVKELRGKRIQLDTGTLAARVAKQKPGEAMALATPHATATVLGTMLQLTVTPESSLLSVQTGQVAFATATQQEIVSAGESARVQDGVLRKVTEPPPLATAVYADGAILFQDSFENGLGKWNLYAKKAGRDQAADVGNDVRIVTMERDGKRNQVAALTGTEPGGRRVGIVMKDIGIKSDAFSMSYDYTYEGRQRLALEGIEIGMSSMILAEGKALPKARPAGEWNTVRWEIVRTGEPAQDGLLPYETRLFFNGELIGHRPERVAPELAGPHLMLEVIEGVFQFDNVIIRDRETK